MNNNIRIIALTPYSEISGETILIGANCTDASFGRTFGGLHPAMISPYRDHAAIEQASQYCWGAALNICGSLSEQLNRILGVKRGPLYWEALLLPWLVAWVENLYDRYLRLDWVRKNMPDGILELPHVILPAPLYQKSFDVWCQSHPHSVNASIYSLLIGCMGMQNNVRFLGIPPEETRTASGISGRQKLKGLVKRYAGSLIKPSPFKQAGINCTELMHESVKDSGFAAQDLDRGSLRIEQPQDEFKKILAILTAKTLPSALFEEYHARSAYAQQLIQKRKIHTLCISNTFWGNDTIKYVLAELRESGARVLGRQHGSGYGNYELNTPEQIERHLTDIFITWGWTDKRHCQTLPLPDPKLSGLSDIHAAANDNILFIGSHGGMYMFRYQSYVIPEFVYDRYAPMQGIFLNALSKAVRSRIVYRPYLVEYGWGERERLKRFQPGIRFDSAPQAIKSMSRCSLAVIDHPGTSLLEALVMNTPTIAYWEPEQSPMRAEAQPYFELLKGAGILFDSPEEAAKQVNSVAGDPQSWWKNNAVQAARRNFCRRFAWAEPDWKPYWVNALKNRTS
ncbi:MAG: hypothetical protein HY846_00260 [Nitrosomonadales bacterium]|nr:hypothetical protein [Nitrosomonadales bacterium]